MQRLGQHFLNDKTALKKIVAALAIARGETVIEVGAGHGELTVPLLKECVRAGAHLVAVEKDKSLARDLRSRIGNSRTANAEIIDGDIRLFLPSRIGHLKSVPYKLVGNIPYYLTGYLLRLIGELPTPPMRAVLTLQKEVVQRLAATPPRMNKLAAATQFWSSVMPKGTIPRTAFRPPPNVDAAIVLLLPLETRATDPARYYRAIRALFAHPRKTLLNNLAGTAARRALRKDAGERNAISRKLEAMGIQPGLRPQDLSISRIAAVADAFFAP